MIFKSIKLIFLIIVLMIAICFVISNNFLTVTNYDFKYAILPDSFDGLRIVHLSDLHSKSFGKNNKRLIRAIEKQKPDIVVMTGDMVNSSDNDYHLFISLAGAIAKKYDTYFIVGNHEQSLKKEQLLGLYNDLAKGGTHVLDNDRVALTKGSGTIEIVGLWFNLRYYSDQTNEYISHHRNEYYFGTDKMNKIIDEKDDSVFTILLTHNPAYFKTYADWGADLTLSGHIHGGMIRLPFLGGILSPDRTYFPKYDAGDFEKEGKHIVVSRGIGNGNEGVRFYNRPEIVSITLWRDE